MNRQSIAKTQKPKNSTLLPASDLLQRIGINRTDSRAPIINTRNPLGEQANKSSFSGLESKFSNDFCKIPVRLKNSRNRIQAKLKIGKPNDIYEQEADRVAEQVMRMPNPELPSSTVVLSLVNGNQFIGEKIQRACNACSEEEEFIQAKTTRSENQKEAPVVSSGIQSLQSGGQPLSRYERDFFEPRFGVDFSNVRVHNDTRAANVARSVNAHAFTHGHNVVFGAGEYSSEGAKGRKLLAHELTHVVQQNGGPNLFSKRINSENTIPTLQKIRKVTPELPILRRKVVDSECAKSAKINVNKHKPSLKHCAVTDVQANDINQHLALDQITVVVLSTWGSGPCKDLKASLNLHCRDWWGKKAPIGENRDIEAERKFTLKILNVFIDPPGKENNENQEPIDDEAGHFARWSDKTEVQKQAARTLAKESGASESVPVPQIYLDRNLMDDGRNLNSSASVERRLSAIASSATSSGAITGMLWGILAGPVGMAIGALIGHLLDIPQGKALGDERRQEIFEYLCVIDKRGPQGDTSLARDAVTLWGEFDFNGADPLFTVAIRRILIRELVEGATGDREERAIIKILERSSDESLAQILDTGLALVTRAGYLTKAIELYTILDEIHGAEYEEILRMLNARYPAFAAEQSKEDVETTTRDLAISDPEVKRVMVKAFKESNVLSKVLRGSMLERKDPSARECGAQFFKNDKGGLNPFENKKRFQAPALGRDQVEKVEVSSIFCAPVRSGPSGGPTSLKFPERDRSVVASFHTHPVGDSKGFEIPSGRDYVGLGLQEINSETSDISPSKVPHPNKYGLEHYVIGPYNLYLIQFNPETKRRTLRTLGRTTDILGVGSNEPPPKVSTALGI